jgi:hypothetical protein
MPLWVSIEVTQSALTQAKLSAKKFCTWIANNEVGGSGGEKVELDWTNLLDVPDHRENGLRLEDRR